MSPKPLHRYNIYSKTATIIGLTAQPIGGDWRLLKKGVIASTPIVAVRLATGMQSIKPCAANHHMVRFQAEHANNKRSYYRNG